MAGTKETPRQQLINIMYLVLLAMLALQVSASIMVKFESMWRNLEETVKHAHQRNSMVYEAIEQEATGKDATDKKREVFEKVKQFKEQSEGIHQYLQEVQDQMIQKGGGFVDPKAKNKLASPDNADAPANLMVVKKGGAEMKKKLDNYIATLNGYVDWINARRPKGKIEKKFESIALDGKNDPIAKHDKENRKKSFASLNFEHVPLVAALATISDKKAAITSMEAALYKEFNQEVSGAIIDITGFKTQVAVAPTLPSGVPTEAKVFLIPNTTQELDIKVGSRSAEITDGYGLYKFSPPVVEERKTITLPVNVNQRLADGSVEEYTDQIEYEAVPLDITAISSVIALYEGCRNPMTIKSSGLGATFNPSFSASNARIQTTSTPTDIAIIPKVFKDNVPMDKRKCTITARQKGEQNFEVGKKTFNVKPVPFPSIHLYPGRGGKIAISEKVCMPAKLPSLIVQIEPDQGFASALPNEATYVIGKGDVTAAKGIKGLGSFDISGARLRKASEAKYGKNAYLVNIPGGIAGSVDNNSRYIVSIEKVLRVASTGQKIPVPMRPVLKTACLK